MTRRRTIIVAAHPDDEVIGAGGSIPMFGDVTVLYVTDGAPRDGQDARAAGFESLHAYAEARKLEARAALALADGAPVRTLSLDFPDQEVSFDLAGLARQLAEVFLQLKPHGIVTHAYEGGHPDHDATAFAVYAALRIVAARSALLPSALEMTAYHDQNGERVIGQFLPGIGGSVISHALDSAARALKRRMLECYATQRAVLADFPVDVERFRSAPRYWWTEAPHTGSLHYERLGIGRIPGARWRELARDALATLPAELRR